MFLTDCSLCVAFLRDGSRWTHLAVVLDSDDDDDGKQLTTVKSGSMCTTCWDICVFFQRKSSNAYETYENWSSLLCDEWWIESFVFSCYFWYYIYIWMDGKHASKANILVILGGIICFVFSRFSTSSSSISMLLFLLLSPDVLSLGLFCGWRTVTNVTAVKCYLNQVKCAQTTTQERHISKPCSTTRKWIRVYHYSSMSKWMIHWKVLYLK